MLLFLGRSLVRRLEQVCRRCSGDLQTFRSLVTDVFGGSRGDILQPGLSNRLSPFSVVTSLFRRQKRERSLRLRLDGTVWLAPRSIPRGIPTRMSYIHHPQNLRSNRVSMRGVYTEVVLFRSQVCELSQAEPVFTKRLRVTGCAPSRLRM